MEYKGVPLDTLLKRHLKGETITALAKELGVSQGRLSQVLQSTRVGSGLNTETRLCVLEECSETFEVIFRSNRRYCCRKHAKLDQNRRAGGRTVTLMECALPGCRVQVKATHAVGRKPVIGGPGHKFCCKAHSDLHSRRRKSGWYLRLLGRSERACEVCGERLVLDEHHEVWDTKTGSDKSSPSHDLCARHHIMIHRGYAAYRDGQYVVLIDELRKAITLKSEVFDNYLGRDDATAG